MWIHTPPPKHGKESLKVTGSVLQRGPAWYMKGLTEPELKLVFPPWEKQINKNILSNCWFFKPTLWGCLPGPSHRFEALSSQNAPKFQIFRQVWDRLWCGRWGERALPRRVPGFLSEASCLLRCGSLEQKGDHCPDQAGLPAREEHLTFSSSSQFQRDC